MKKPLDREQERATIALAMGSQQLPHAQLAALCPCVTRGVQMSVSYWWPTDVTQMNRVQIPGSVPSACTYSLWALPRFGKHNRVLNSPNFA